MSYYINTCSRILLDYKKLPRKLEPTPKKIRYGFLKLLSATVDTYPELEDIAAKGKASVENTKEKFSDYNNIEFNELWEYCEFIRWCEKMLLCKNEKSESLYSDAPMDSLDDRTLYVNKDGYYIAVTLKMSKKADFDSVTDSLKFRTVTDLVIVRNFGNEMRNKYTIVDSAIKYSEPSDRDLIYLSLNILYDSIVKHYHDVMKRLLCGNFIDAKAIVPVIGSVHGTEEDFHRSRIFY